MSITFKSTAITGKNNHHTPVFVSKKNTPKALKPICDDLKDGEIFSIFGSSDYSGSTVSVLKLDSSKEELGTEDFRVWGGQFFQEFKKNKSKVLALDSSLFLAFNDPLNSVYGFIEGFLLSDYQMNEGKSDTQKKADTKIEIYTNGLKGEQIKRLKVMISEAETVAESVHLARRLGDLPGNMMTPTILAKNAESLKKHGVKVTVWNKARIKKEKMDCLLGVSNGSAEEPKFIIMEYKSKNSKATKPTLLVGKGLTFDAGGISLKPSAKMDEMRFDMCGGGAVIGAMHLIAKMKVPAYVVALVPSTENLLGAAATKPGDIFKARNGKTVEVLNTDAEGRLILADALSYASELNPKQVLSAATLTGAMVMALGNTHTGFFCRDSKLTENLNETSKTSGENLWQLPLTDDHSSDMQGTYADLSNLASFRGAGSATAAAFLENFVDKKIPYAHLDIAGTAWNAQKRKSYHTTNGATGVLVRSFYHFIKNYN